MEPIDPLSFALGFAFAFILSGFGVLILAVLGPKKAVRPVIDETTKLREALQLVLLTAHDRLVQVPGHCEICDAVIHARKVLGENRPTVD